MVFTRGGVVAQTGEGTTRGDGRRGVRADPEDAPVAGGGDGTGRVERGGGSARAGVRSQPRVARGSATGTRRRAEAAAEGARAAGGDKRHGQARLKAQPAQRGRGPAGVAAAEDFGGTFTPGGPGGVARKGGERVGRRRRPQRRRPQRRERGQGERRGGGTWRGEAASGPGPGGVPRRAHHHARRG